VQALRDPAGVDPLGPLDPDVVLAVGTSQSGSRLAAYHNSIWPLTKPVVDGFFVGESTAQLRGDLDVPVLRLLSEVDTTPGFAPPDTATYRHWEVAGTSHADAAFIETIRPILVRDQAVQVEPTCVRNPLSRIPKRYAYHAAWDHLVDWVRLGTPPPVAPRIDVAGGAIQRDARGNALGGIRLSEHAVPTAVNGAGNAGGNQLSALFCRLFGVHEPFTADTLASLYPSTGRYVSQVARTNAANVRAGFLLPADADTSTSTAARSGIGRR
jgi:hypothetical protein